MDFLHIMGLAVVTLTNSTHSMEQNASRAGNNHSAY